MRRSAVDPPGADRDGVGRISGERLGALTAVAVAWLAGLFLERKRGLILDCVVGGNKRGACAPTLAVSNFSRESGGFCHFPPGLDCQCTLDSTEDNSSNEESGSGRSGNPLTLHKLKKAACKQGACIIADRHSGRASRRAAGPATPHLHSKCRGEERTIKPVSSGREQRSVIKSLTKALQQCALFARGGQRKKNGIFSYFCQERLQRRAGVSKKKTVEISEAYIRAYLGPLSPHSRSPTLALSRGPLRRFNSLILSKPCIFARTSSPALTSAAATPGLLPAQTLPIQVATARARGPPLVRALLMGIALISMWMSNPLAPAHFT
ncbi:uncharacterized protein VTP21DRAFT_5504 [Calcarisporiella thermophila]|uniref:uncharacterized protein n=1 Tax=Calcarisporiella thermophila TaxID=911321 RepID=UPI003743D6E0